MTETRSSLVHALNYAWMLQQSRSLIYKEIEPSVKTCQQLIRLQQVCRKQ